MSTPPPPPPSPPLVDCNVIKPTLVSNTFRKPTGIPNFDDRSAYKDRSLIYLLKALVILRLCSIEVLAKNSVPILKKFESVFGPFLTYNLMVKYSFYDYFCAGENEVELSATVKRLVCKGVGSVLDYAAEADVEGFTPSPGAEEAPEISMAKLVNKPNVSYLANRTMFDENMKLYMMSIMHASINPPASGPGVIAVKVSGMCNPQLLARMNAILMSIHQSWCQHFTQEETPRLEECRVLIGLERKHRMTITHDQFREGFKRRLGDKPLDETLAAEMIKTLDPSNKGTIHYLDYVRLLTDAVSEVDPSPLKERIASLLPLFNPTEKRLWRDINTRLHLIASTAQRLDVRVMIDAEQSFYQLAIDALTLHLQVEFNKEAAIVYNTYQCYLTYAEDRIAADLLRAEKMGFLWGGKIVRGAYMIQERKTAEEYNYTSPIWPTIEGTAKCYADSAKRIFAAMERNPDKKYEVFFGTHNEKMIHDLAKRVYETPALQAHTTFGQLYGMRDNITFPLAACGFCVYKYLPYGPARETIHYLGRRAVENSAILADKNSTEVRLMREEIRRRLTFRS
uniref:Proline dehydrogenase n=1 Tax=Strigomonas galati TaxID=1003336 RepID=U5KLX0_9TRYP|nr:proline dehydrogenase [Strigomonas galati]